jgi:hypothetical protein
MNNLHVRISIVDLERNLVAVLYFAQSWLVINWNPDKSQCGPIGCVNIDRDISIDVVSVGKK